MNSEYQRSLLALWNIPRFGVRQYQRLKSFYPDISKVFQAPAHDLQLQGFTEAFIEQIKHPHWQTVDRYLEWATHINQAILFFEEPYYPSLLKEIASPPLVLFIRGDKKSLQTTQIAIVGSRQPSITGREIAIEFAEQLAKTGLTITSGLALGIDAASHQGALRAKGRTIAVLGTGINVIYPKNHRHLAEEIAERGALISEFPLNSPAHPEHFPQRNRIISGLSLGTLVIEAALKSGSLITAQYAVEQNREVFAIPGSLRNPLSHGCHRLIREGAKLVENTKDILEELGLQTSTEISEKKVKPLLLQGDYQRLAKCFGYETTPIDLIISRSGLPTATVMAMLLELELQNFITPTPGGYALSSP